MSYVYIAAPWGYRAYARRMGALIEDKGHTITHKWWDHDVPDQDEAGLRKCAEDDFEAILRADVFLLLNTQPRGEETSGKAVEFGIALAINRFAPLATMRIMAAGIRTTNVFQLLPEVEWFPTVEDAIDAIR